MPPKTDRVSPVFTLFAGAVLIALAPVLTKQALVWGEMSSSAVAFWRLLLAWPLLWAFSLASSAPPTPSSPSPENSEAPPDPAASSEPIPSSAAPLPSRFWMAVPGVFFGLDLFFWHWSFLYTTAANATLLVNASSLIASLFGWLWWKERLGIDFFTGVAISLAGAGLILGVSFQSSPTQIQGDLLALGGAFFYAGYLIGLKLLRQWFPAARIVAWSSFSGAIVVAIPTFLFPSKPALPATFEAWLAIGGLAIFTHAIGHTLIASSSSRLPVSFSSIVLLFQPLGAAFFAWLFLKETITFLQMIGGCLILAGIGLAHRSSFRTNEDKTLLVENKS